MIATSCCKTFILAGLAASAWLPARAQITGGYAVDLDGVSGQVQIHSNASLTLSDRATFEAWIYPTEAKCNTILSRGDGGTSSAYILNVGYGDYTCGNMNVGFWADGQWDFSSSIVPLNAWSHVAVTYDGFNKHFYINGVPDGSVSAPGALSQSGGPIFIGRQGTTCNCNFFHGRIDEVRIWNTVRLVSEISTNQSVLLTGAEPGLVAYYRFDEGNGSTVNDLTGNGNTGVLTNGAAWAQVYPYTPAASALSFDGVSSYVQLDTNVFLDMPAYSHTITVEAWVYPTGPVCRNTVVSLGSGIDASTDYIVEIGYDGLTCSGQKLGFYAGGLWDASFSPIPSNTWTHIAVTYDGANKNFYINGVLDRTAPRSGSFTNSGSHVYIGRQGEVCNCNFFRGIIDEVRIWRNVRSQAQLAQNKNSVTSVPGDRYLMAYYHFDEGSGGVTVDSARVVPDPPAYFGGLSNGPAWVSSSAPIIAPPDVSTYFPSNLTATSAVLNGNVNPHAEPTAAWFEYGTNLSFGNTTSPTNLPAVNSPVLMSSGTLSLLNPATTTYYRVVGSNHDGTTYSAASPLGPPVLTSLEIESGPEVYVNAHAYPQGAPTSVYVEYGTNATYGSTVPFGIVEPEPGVDWQTVRIPFAPPLHGFTYHAHLVASNVFGISDTGDQQFTTPPAMPVIVSSSVSQVTSNSATFNAVINPNGAGVVWFAYYDYLPIFYANAGSFNDSFNVSISLPISGLTTMTQYFFQVYVLWFGSTVYGPWQNFYTFPPAVITSAADQVGSAHATLNGQVNGYVLPTVGWFEYGLTPGYGSSTPPVDLGSSTLYVPASALLSNLAPGTSYNFRAVATNTVGLTYGGNLTFQTAPQARITGLSSQTNGQFLLQFSGTTGINYTLQVSSNLFQWLNLTTLSPDTNGLFHYLASGTNGPMQFYRLSNP